MIAATLDSKVLVSGFVRPDSAPGEVLRRLRDGAFRLAISDHIIDEVTSTLQEPYFRRHLTEQQIADDLALLQDEGDMVGTLVEVSGIATHPEDDLVLATAVSGRVGYLVTGDKQLLRLGSYEGVVIVSPRVFLDLLEREKQGK